MMLISAQIQKVTEQIHYLFISVIQSNVQLTELTAKEIFGGLSKSKKDKNRNMLTFCWTAAKLRSLFGHDCVHGQGCVDFATSSTSSTSTSSSTLTLSLCSPCYSIFPQHRSHPRPLLCSDTPSELSLDRQLVVGGVDFKGQCSPGEQSVLNDVICV